MPLPQRCYFRIVHLGTVGFALNMAVKMDIGRFDEGLHRL